MVLGPDGSAVATGSGKFAVGPAHHGWLMSGKVSAVLFLVSHELVFVRQASHYICTISLRPYRHHHSCIVFPGVRFDFSCTACHATGCQSIWLKGHKRYGSHLDGLSIRTLCLEKILPRGDFGVHSGAYSIHPYLIRFFHARLPRRERLRALRSSALLM